MADPKLAERPAFVELALPATDGLSVCVRNGLTLAGISARKGKRGELGTALHDRYGIVLPAAPRRVAGGDIAFMLTGPDQWLAVADGTTGRDLERELKPLLAGLAAVVDQSDARAVLRIAGPRSREVLAKGVAIDLDPRAFGPGDVAVTHASHIGIMLWQLDGVPTYELAVSRSYAQSLVAWLSASAGA